MGVEKYDYTKVLDYVKSCIESGHSKSISDIARRFNIPRTTIRSLLERSGLANNFKKSQQKLEVVIQQEKEFDEKRESKKQYRRAISQIRDLETELRIAKDLSKLTNVITPSDIVIKEEKDKKEAVAVALASDWHYEEEVKPRAVNNVNSFNLTVAKRRTGVFFERTLRLLEMCRTASNIKQMVVAALGDFITSWIHPDLVSETTPPEALLLVLEQWITGLDFWLKESNLDEIIFVGVCGNHTRITAKTHYKKTAEKNYEWLLYHFLAKWFSDKKYKTKIKFLLPTGYFNWLEVYGRVLRFHHGDGIRYWGGVGGLHIPLRKAIAQWNQAKHADLDILGHWHTRKIERNYVVNGSLIGYNEFAQAIKADYEPASQSFFILHPKYEKTAEFNIMLD